MRPARVSVVIETFVDLDAIPWRATGSAAAELEAEVAADPEAVLWLAETGLVRAVVEDLDAATS